MELSILQTVLLSALIVVVLILPLTVHKVEENLELFLFARGAFAVTVSHVCVKAIGLRWTLFLIVLILGLTSSIITAIIAALILSEIAVMLPLERAGRIKLITFSCYAIGMGAVLTSIGEPLGTVVISKLAGPPHNAGFFYLIEHLGWFVLGGVLFMAGMASSIREGTISHAPGAKAAQLGSDNTVKGIAVRAGKVYLFVVALVFLGDGLKPLALKTITHLHASWLYWINMLSAVLDNATLAAIEVTPAIDDRTLTFLLMSLVISGGMLIPGNIPNIICASKLGIKSKEWVKAAFGLGLVLMIAYFFILTAVL